MASDILTGFTQETIDLRADSEGEVVATLVARKAAAISGGTHKAVLYVHGYIDYFFNVELADRYNQEGYDFYALDLRKYGRSLRPHQTPYFVDSLDDYFEELDAAIERIRQRDGHSFLLLNAHSTGGLICALYAHERRYSNTLDALFLNSPFLDLNSTWLDENITADLAAGVGAIRPLLNVRGASPSLYVESIHKNFQGEWDFRLDWKPHESFPTKAGWLRAIREGHDKLQDGLEIPVPILVMFSTESSWAESWDDILLRTDSVLDVSDIDRYAEALGPDVTEVRIEGGMHDLVLSAKPVREKVYQELFAWLRSRGF
jgi:alpha-beta hydrolase superfamily lysophospholipase